MNIKQEIRNKLKGFGIEGDNRLLRSVIYSLLGRYLKYGDNTGISRKEFKKFKTTEFTLYKIIQQLKVKGLIKGQGKMHSRVPASYEMLAIIEIFEIIELLRLTHDSNKYGYIKNINTVIYKLMQTTGGASILKLFGVHFKNYRTGLISKKKGEKITASHKHGAVTIYSREGNKSYTAIQYLIDICGLDFTFIKKGLISNGLIW